MSSSVRFPIRQKLLILLVTIPIVSIGFSIVFGTMYFVGDKKSYIFDSSAKNAQVIASEYYLSNQSMKSVLKPILHVANIKKIEFGLKSQARFSEQKMFEYLYLLDFSNGKVKVADKLVKHPREMKKYKLNPSELLILKESLRQTKEILYSSPEKSRFFNYLKKIKLEGDREVYLFGILKLPELYEAFATPGLYATYLVHESGRISISPNFWRESKKDQIISDPRFFLPAFRSRSPQGVFEKNVSEKTKLLVAYSETKVPGTYALSIVNSSVFMGSVHRYLAKSILFLVLVISAVFLIGFIASSELTNSLRSLMEMTKKIAGGQFNIKSLIRTNDEFQVLGENVQWMSNEVQNLMLAQVEKARMENELGMIQLVQKNLFPEPSLSTPEFDIECRFSSASEAGGDWFHYSIFDDQIIIWIGDATGHGAPAALVTAAAKSASSVIELSAEEELLDPSLILKTMNRAVSATAKKSVMMTFFVASINLKTGEVTYANASHEPPILVPRKEKLHKRDFKYLCEVNGRRLGEFRDSEYTTSTYQLNPGDTLFFYTDGVTDLENPESKAYGDGRLTRTLAKIGNMQGISASKMAEKLDSNFESYRGNKTLVDDLMFIVFKYRPEVESAERKAS